MAFNIKFWERKNSVATPETILPWRADSFNNQYFGLGYFRGISIEQAMRYPPFARCIKLLSMQGASVVTNTLRVVDSKTGDIISTRNGDRMLAMMRESPNGYDSAREFFEWLFQDLLIYGNALVYLEPSPVGGVMKFVRMNVKSATADMYDAKMGPETLVYEMRPFGYDSDKTMYSQRDVVHARYKSPDMDYMNYNGSWMAPWPLTYLTESIVTGLRADGFVGDFFDSAAKNDMVIQFPNNIGEEQQMEMLELFDLAQTDKRHPLIMSQGADIKTIKHTPQTADVRELRKYQTAHIGRFYGVPPAMLGEDSTPWAGGLEELTRQLWRTGTKFAVDTLIDKFSLRLLPRGQMFSTNASEEIRGNLKTVISLLQAAKPTTNSPPVLSRKEMRGFLGLPDDFKDDYGDWAKWLKPDNNLKSDDDAEDEPEDEDEDDVDNDEEMSDTSDDSRDD